MEQASDPNISLILKTDLSANLIMKNQSQRSHLYVDSVGSTSLEQFTTDQAIERVGGNHRFQYVYAGLNFLTLTIFNDMLIYPLSFLNNKEAVSFICRNGESCSAEEACLAGNYRIDWTKSKHNFISDFRLECYSSFHLSLMGTLFFLGFATGSLFWLYLSDKIGKRKVILTGLVCHLLIVILVLTVYKAWIPYAFCLCLGLQFASTTHAAYLMILEIVSVTMRVNYSMVWNMVTGAINIWQPLYFKYAFSFRYLYQVNIGLTLLGFVFYLFFLPESPRFLVANGKYKEARKLLKRIAKFNKKPMFSNRFQGQTQQSTDFRTEQKPTHQKGGLRFLCDPVNHLLIPTVLTPIMWFTVVIVYYGINFGLGKLTGDIYLNGVISGVAQVVGYLISGLLSNIYGRRFMSIVSFAISGVACIVYPFISSHLVLGYFCVMFGKLGVGSAFQLVMLWTTEIFPTRVRGTAFGFCNIFGRIGGIVAPQISSLIPNYFMLLFGMISVLCCLISFFLKETHGIELEDNKPLKEEANQK